MICASCWRKNMRTAIADRISQSRYSVIAHENTLEHSWLRLEERKQSSSPAVSAKTPLKSDPGSAKIWNGWVLNWTSSKTNRPVRKSEDESVLTPVVLPRLLLR